MHLKLTCRLLRRHLNHHRTYFYAETKKGKCHTRKKKKKKLSGIKPRTPRSEGRLPTCSPSQVFASLHVKTDMDLYVRIDVWEKMTKRRNSTHRRETGCENGLGRYLQGREGRVSEARPAISAPRGGPHLDLGRVRLKTWSKSDSSIAGMTWPTLSSM